jgi:hypothetical protein
MAPLAFRLMRHGSDIGRHTVTFSQLGDRLSVHVAVDALVTLLSIPIVRYSHRATEVWQGGALVAVAGTTDKSGRHGWVDARHTPYGLLVSGSQTPRYLAPAGVFATSYWNKHMLDGPMISLEDGVLLRPHVAEPAPGSVKLASGGVIPADHYNLSGAFRADVWYDRSDTWADLGGVCVSRAGWLHSALRAVVSRP